MKVLHITWSRFAVMVLAFLMVVGMAACGKRPAESTPDQVGQGNTQTQDQGQTKDEQQGGQGQDQEQVTDKQENAGQEGSEDVLELPEDVFDENTVQQPNDEELSGDIPSVDYTKEDETSSNENVSYDIATVLPDDVWE